MRERTNSPVVSKLERILAPQVYLTLGRVARQGSREDVESVAWRSRSKRDVWNIGFSRVEEPRLRWEAKYPGGLFSQFVPK